MSNAYSNFILWFTISVSVFGLFMTLIFTFYPPITYESFSWRKPLIGSIFSLICIFGITASFFPKQCSETLHFRKEKMNFTSNSIHAVLRGHHPSCQRFSAHVIHINTHVICAACMGLFAGAAIALAGSTFYFFAEWNLKQSFPAVLIGIAGVTFGFLQLKFRGFIRLILNTFFVLGAFLILVGIDELTQNLFVDLFQILSIVFWILTRISLSKWDHHKTCNNCSFQCEFYKSKKE